MRDDARNFQVFVIYDFTFSAIMHQSRRDRRWGSAPATCAASDSRAVENYTGAQKEENSRSPMQAQNAIAERVRKDNENLRRMNSSTKHVVADSIERLRTLQSDAGTRRMLATEVKTERARVESNKQVIEDTLEYARSLRNKFKEAASKLHADSASTALLDHEISAFECSVNELETSAEELRRNLI